MREFHLAMMTLLFLSSAAFAQSEHRLADAASPDGGRHPAIASMGPAASWPLARNANDCPPDRAEPVWGANSALLGYACIAKLR